MSLSLSLAQFLQMYGDVEVKFSSYYKFTFTFKGICASDGKNITVRIGGDVDDIYRMDISADAYSRVEDFKFDLLSWSIT